MKSWKKRALVDIPAALLCVFIVFPLSASAWTQDAELCYRTQGNMELKISYCTKAIESGLLNGMELSTTYTNRGLGYREKGDHERALEDYDSAIRITPDNGQALVARGNLFRANGEETKAQADFAAAIAVPIPADSNYRPYLDRSRAYIAKGDLTSALADLNTANRLNPTIREIYINRASIYYQRKDYRSAVNEYTGALKLNPKDDNALNARASMFVDLGEFENALADCNAAINANQFVAEYYDHRSRVQRMLGNQDEAIADLGFAIQLQPRRGIWYVARAAAYRMKSDWKDAMADYDRSLQAEPASGIYHGYRADEREYEGDYAGALEDRDEAIVLDAKNADLRVARAWTLFYMGRSEEALAGFADAIRIDPKAAGRYRSRALALVKLGRYDEALADYDAAVKIEPARGINYASREYVYEYRGEPLAGLPDIERGRIADPEFAEASNWRGVAQLLALNMDGAINEFTAYIQARPNTSIGFDNRGFTRMIKGDCAGAATDFHKSMDFNLWVPYTMLWMHWCNVRLGIDDHEEFAKNATRTDPKKWPGQALRFELGQISLEEMLAGAKDSSELATLDQESEAYFIAGEHFLLIHDIANAEKMFLEAIARNRHNSVEDAGARAELATLKK
jgi:tetratricopeptide (TPR) repeat protein